MTRLILIGLSLFVVSAAAYAQQPVTEPATTEAESKVAYVMLQTSKGDIVLELDGERAPETVKNFLTYVKEGFYTDTAFHRVIKGFMIQGGGYPKDNLSKEKDTHDSIKNEGGNGLLNEKYTVAMARTSDPDSATSQFFINHGDNDFLNRRSAQDGVGYAVFGKVVKGQDIVDKIASGTVTNGPTGERSFPIVPVVVTDCKVVEKP
jgi:cyclophilin family peptidyl-prolyl cis-trans isomerase